MNRDGVECVCVQWTEDVCVVGLGLERLLRRSHARLVQRDHVCVFVWLRVNSHHYTSLAAQLLAPSAHTGTAMSLTTHHISHIEYSLNSYQSVAQDTHCLYSTHGVPVL